MCTMVLRLHSPALLNDEGAPVRGRRFRDGRSGTNLVRKCFFADLIEGLNNDVVVTLRIQLKKALQKVLKIVL